MDMMMAVQHTCTILTHWHICSEPRRQTISMVYHPCRTSRLCLTFGNTQQSCTPSRQMFDFTFRTVNNCNFHSNADKDTMTVFRTDRIDLWSVQNIHIHITERLAKESQCRTAKENILVVVFFFASNKSVKIKIT